MSNRAEKSQMHNRHEQALRLGCVSFLNAKPLIEGVSERFGVDVRYDVPSQLLDDLLSGQVDVALCPVIDLFTSSEPLEIVPCGCIGCDGPTLTVRLYSQSPIEELDTIYADTDSHTSVALLRLLYRMRHNRTLNLIDFHARERVADGKMVEHPEAMLLIGDKVVTDSPPAVTYPYQLDLGEAWKELTGLPFVFAVWMTRPATRLGDLPEQLSETLEANLKPDQLETIIQTHAESHGWPADLAHSYLGRILSYRFESPQLEAVSRFAEHLIAHNLIRNPRPIMLHTTTPSSP